MKLHRKSIVILIAVLLITATSSLSSAENKLIGIGCFLGEQVPNDPIWHTSGKHDWSYTSINGMYGWRLSNKTDVFIEAGIGQYNFDNSKDIYAFGISLMADYNFIEVGRTTIYGEAGGGFGYWNDTPNKKLVGTKACTGLIKYGVGLKIKVNGSGNVKLGYRLHHASDPFASDTGANSCGVVFSFIKTF